MNDFIEEYPNTVTQIDCQKIISWYEKSKNLQEQGLVGAGRVDLKTKECSQISMCFLKEPNDINVMILSYLIEGLKKYKKKNSEIDNYIYPWGTCPDWNLQKYLPKQGYHGIHCEATSPENSFRVMAWMIYLNTVKDKGGTCFPLQRKTVAAEEGKLVLWPAYWTHIHHGVVSPTETKYIATGWFTFNQDNPGGKELKIFN